jgi:hypothetical protein
MKYFDHIQPLFSLSPLLLLSYSQTVPPMFHTHVIHFLGLDCTYETGHAVFILMKECHQASQGFTFLWEPGQLVAWASPVPPVGTLCWRSWLSRESQIVRAERVPGAHLVCLLCQWPWKEVTCPKSPGERYQNGFLDCILDPWNQNEDLRCFS